MPTEMKTKQNEAAKSDESDLDADTLNMLSAAIESKKSKREQKLKKQKATAVIITASAVIFSGVAVYLGGWATSMGAFLPNTYINDVDVSKLSLTSASAAIQGNSLETSLNIRVRGGDTIQIPLGDFDYTKDIYSAVKKLYDNIEYSKWIGANFKNTNYYIDTEAKYDNEKLKKVLRKTVWGTQDTQDARFVHGADGFYIQPEVYGDVVDLNKLVEYVTAEVAEGRLDIDLTQSGCYSDPKVFSSDLEGRLDELNASFNFVVTLDFDYTQEILSGADVFEWAKDDGTIDRDRVADYVASLAGKYDTFMTPRKFTTHAGKDITIDQGRYSTGQYGWWIDQEKTVDKLLECFAAHDTVTIDPVYVQLESGYTYAGYESGRSAESDIGSTYVEVDLTNQHLWYYQNGEVKFETGQIVSGKATDSSRKTPPGVYSVYSKSTNYTMRTSEYSAKCAYFMRLSFEGIGFHDLSRSVYGGNTYINNGSHGCINMKYAEVAQLYELVERGTPVVMYY